MSLISCTATRHLLSTVCSSVPLLVCFSRSRRKRGYLHILCTGLMRKEARSRPLTRLLRACGGQGERESRMSYYGSNNVFHGFPTMYILSLSLSLSLSSFFFRSYFPSIFVVPACPSKSFPARDTSSLPYLLSSGPRCNYYHTWHTF